MALRLLNDEQPKPPRRKGDRAPLITHEKAERFRLAMRNLRVTFSWGCFAKLMGTNSSAIGLVMCGRNSISGEMVVKAIRASGSLSPS